MPPHTPVLRAANRSLGSYQVISQLLQLRQLAAHRADMVVAHFLDCLEQALRERVWLYQWLTKHREPSNLAESP